jgi:hypothetical protein
VTDDVTEFEEQFEWSPLHLLPFVWFDASQHDEPITAKGIVVRWNDGIGEVVRDG